MRYWTSGAFIQQSVDDLRKILSAIPIVVLVAAALAFGSVSAAIITLWLIGRLTHGVLLLTQPDPEPVDDLDAWRQKLETEIAKTDGLQAKLDILERELNEDHEVFRIGNITVVRRDRDDGADG